MENILGEEKKLLCSFALTALHGLE